MSKLADAIKEKVLKPELDRQNHPTTATVIDYDYKTNTANIIYTNSKSGDKIKVDNVQVMIDSPGVIGQGLSTGTRCMIIFPNGFGLAPIINKIIDENFTENTRAKTKHSRKGAFLPDYICMR